MEVRAGAIDASITLVLAAVVVIRTGLVSIGLAPTVGQ
jgi:hypothetical protein